MLRRMQLSIGELARHTGVPVKRIRHYAELGLLPEAGRSAGGYRRFSPESVARLQFIVTLRKLGVGLQTIAEVLNHSRTLDEVIRRHAAALDAEIEQLVIRRGVLRALARSQPTPQEIARMAALSEQSAEESRRVMEDFISSVFADHPDDPFRERMVSGLPELGDNPSAEAVEAWTELAVLVSDKGFRERVREMVEAGSRRRGQGDSEEPAQNQMMTLAARAADAQQAGIPPESKAAAAILDEGLASGPRSGPSRAELAERIESFSDPRVERYWELVGRINGWPERPSLGPAMEWVARALRAHPNPGA